jgi:hypothetical protein
MGAPVVAGERYHHMLVAQVAPAKLLRACAIGAALANKEKGLPRSRSSPMAT